MNAKNLIEEFIAAYEELKILALTLTRNESDALDLMQDLAEILITKGEELQHVRIPIAYFKTCLRHIQYNKAAKSSRELAIDPEAMEDLGAAYPVELESSCIEIIEWLNRELSSSPPEFKEAFIKYYIEGHELQYLARELNVTTNTLAQKFSRMRKKLKRSSSIFYMAFLMLVLYQVEMGRVL